MIKYLVNMIKSEENRIKIAITGNVDCGKSTLIGVLVNNILDNGRGSARKSIMKMKHELDTGRTSSISFNYIKYKYEDGVPIVTKGINDREEIKKIITLVDLAGHEKYLKTFARLSHGE